jgi:NADH-quinone oxidoreductase subunit M
MAISQFGSVLVGVGSLSAPGLVGAIYQCFSLGLAIAAFGLFIGALTSRGGSSEYQTTNGDYLYGGVAIRAPLMAVVAGASIASFLGLPGTSGFIGQALMVVGSYSVHPFVVVLALVCLLLAAYYLFTMYRFIFLGEEKKGSKPVEDLNPWERAYLFPLIICLLIFGLYPKPLIDLVRPTVLTILSTVH